MIAMTNKTKLINLPVLVILLLAVHLPSVTAEELPQIFQLNSTYTDSPPTIDGFLNPDEWINGINITLNGFNNPNHRKNGMLYLMNDNLTLYIALVIPDSTLDSSTDYAMCDFDQGNNHYAATGGEDALGYNALASGYSDAYWDGYWWAGDVDGSGTSHGSGSRGYSSEQYVYEFSKPLNSGESKDMTLSPGDVIGFRIETWDQSEYEYYRFPENTVDSDASHWNEWADLIIGDRISECPVKGDSSSCDGKVDDFEILDYINKWAAGDVSDFDLLEAINNWAT